MTAVWQIISHWSHSPVLQVFLNAEWKNIHMLQVLEGNSDLIGVIEEPYSYPTSL